jgi:hypothetical protein
LRADTDDRVLYDNGFSFPVHRAPLCYDICKNDLSAEH